MNVVFLFLILICCRPCCFKLLALKKNYKILTPLLTLIALSIFAQSPALSENMPNFSQSPKKNEWQVFMRMKSHDYSHLWDSQHLVEKGFHTWSWEWKIGWLRTCKGSYGYCKKLFILALEDKAAVVRSAAAEKISSQYYQSDDKDLLDKISVELRKDRNKKLKNSWPVESQLRLALSCIVSTDGGNTKAGKELRNKLAKVCLKR